MSDSLQRICVYCGSSSGFDPAYTDVAHRLGIALAEQGIELVYGGADIGLMGEVANTVLHHGGKVIGVIPDSLAEKVSHQSLTDLRIVGSMHERKAMMIELSDAFIALPGGLGTLEELAEALTWTQLGITNKPSGILNTRGYYNSLLAFLDNGVIEGFIRPVHREMLLQSEEPAELISMLANYDAPVVDKWLGIKTRV